MVVVHSCVISASELVYFIFDCRYLEVTVEQLSVAEIWKVIRRGRKVMENFLKHVEDYGKKKSTGYPIVISE